MQVGHFVFVLCLNSSFCGFEYPYLFIFSGLDLNYETVSSCGSSKSFIIRGVKAIGKIENYQQSKVRSNLYHQRALFCMSARRWEEYS